MNLGYKQGDFSDQEYADFAYEMRGRSSDINNSCITYINLAKPDILNAL